MGSTHEKEVPRHDTIEKGITLKTGKKKDLRIQITYQNHFGINRSERGTQTRYKRKRIYAETGKNRKRIYPETGKGLF